MQTVLAILGKTTEFFAKAGIQQARLDAEHLLAHVLGCKRLDVYLQFERPLTDAELDALRPLVRRRARREPLQHILGTVDFHGLTLHCDARALVPRPETEWLAERVIERLADRPPARVADLGTGTGALAFALATAFPAARVDAVDRCAEALSLARENAAALGLADRVAFHEGDWFGPVKGRRYDAIVANPPYLSEADWDAAEPEVARFDPKTALVAAGEGTADLAHIIRSAPAHLQPGGLLALETNEAQHASLAEHCQAPAYASVESECDHAKRERYLFLTAFRSCRAGVPSSGIPAKS